jgi:hypothetical protein
MTTITFDLHELRDGTRLVITESGFEALPESRRAEAHAANEGGWEHQLKLVEKFVVVPY